MSPSYLLKQPPPLTKMRPTLLPLLALLATLTTATAEDAAGATGALIGSTTSAASSDSSLPVVPTSGNPSAASALDIPAAQIAAVLVAIVGGAALVR